MINPALKVITENDQQYDEADLIFQLESAPPDHALFFFFDQYFLRHGTVRKGSIEWLFRPPDLYPPDYFLWGKLQSAFRFD